MVDVRSLADEETDQLPDLRELGHINESQLAAQVQQGRVPRGFRQGCGRGHGRIHVRTVFQQNMCDLQCGVRSVQVQGKKGRGHFPAEIGIVPGFAVWNLWVILNDLPTMMAVLNIVLERAYDSS